MSIKSANITVLVQTNMGKSCIHLYCYHLFLWKQILFPGIKHTRPEKWVSEFLFTLSPPPPYLSFSTHCICFSLRGMRKSDARRRAKGWRRRGRGWKEREKREMTWRPQRERGGQRRELLRSISRSQSSHSDTHTDMHTQDIKLDLCIVDQNIIDIYCVRVCVWQELSEAAGNWEQRAGATAVGEMTFQLSPYTPRLIRVAVVHGCHSCICINMDI